MGPSLLGCDSYYRDVSKSRYGGVPFTSIQNVETLIKGLDGQHVKSLMESIRVHGLLNPIHLQATGGTGYRLLCGHHRLAAWYALAYENGENHLERYHSIPAVVYSSDMAPELCELVALQDNLLRREFTDEEKHEMLQRVLRLRQFWNEFKEGQSQEMVRDIFKAIGDAHGLRWQAVRQRWMRYFDAKRLTGVTIDLLKAHRQQFEASLSKPEDKPTNSKKDGVSSGVPRHPRNDLPPVEPTSVPRPTFDELSRASGLTVDQLKKRWSVFRESHDIPNGTTWVKADEKHVDEFTEWVGDAEARAASAQLLAEQKKHKAATKKTLPVQTPVIAPKADTVTVSPPTAAKVAKPLTVTVSTDSATAAIRALVQYFEPEDLFKALEEFV